MNVREILKKYDIHPKKSLGQNFLTAVPTLEKIVRELAPTPNDKVLEIGPGPGIMTKMLTEHAKFVAAIETDKKMIKILENEWGDTSNLHIIHGDVLDTNLEKLLQKKNDWIFIGNIPYNITAPLLFHIRKHRRFFRYGLLLIQREVADRITASPGSKDYGILSIAMQSVARIKKSFNVSASSFHPAPKVESAVIRISFEGEPPYKIEDLDFFTTVVKAAFSTRRKRLANSLSQSRLLDIPKEDIEDTIKKVGIDKDARAEVIKIDTFIELTNALARV